jgi:two-component system, cell cycle sensor histidine kinase and response regulator CckA
MSKATILIVEDDAILALDLRRMISRLGYTVFGPLASGEEALALLAGQPVDLVLMDIELAGPINGIDTAETILRTVGVPVVFLTGFSQDPLLEQAKIAAPYGYLIKPVPEQELAATLEIALHRHMLDRQLKETLAELRESEQNYKNLTESGQILIWTSGEDKLCNYFNKIWLNFTGRTLHQELGTGWLENVHPDDRQRCLDIYTGAFDRREKFNMEYRLRRHDGAYGWIFDEGSPRCNSQGRFIGYIGHCLDITEHKEAEKRNAKLEAENRQLQKAESLGRMAGAIAHHFNNKLGAVIGNLELAIDELPGDAGVVKILSKAMQAAQMAAEVSGLMLTYLGQTVGTQTALDLSEVCRQSLPLLQATSTDSHYFKVDLPIAGPMIRANVNQIQQLLTSLITNAREAIGMNQGGIELIVKTVSLTDIPGACLYPIDWQPADIPYACLEVRDTGCGIAEFDIDKLGDPFYSSKSDVRGLGLPIVLGIVKAHGGAVTVASEVGCGSTFRVFLPVSSEVLPCRLDRATEPPVRRSGGTVLLIDDEDMLREMANRMLTRLGYKVLAAKDGVEALEIFNEHPDAIDVVLSDLSMPRMNGWDTLTALRQIRPDIPVVLASGHDQSKVLAGDHPELPQVFLHKPYQKAELQAALVRAMDGKNDPL